MITTLESYYTLNARLSKKEFYVQASIFREVIREKLLTGELHNIQLNQPHESVRYRYIHVIYLKGIKFIHVSQERLSRESETVSSS